MNTYVDDLRLAGIEKCTDLKLNREMMFTVARYIQLPMLIEQNHLYQILSLIVYVLQLTCP